MSYVSTYDRKTPTPKGIGMTVAVHAVVIAAIMATPGVSFTSIGKGDVEIFNIPKPASPEEEIKEQKPEIQIPRDIKIKTPIPPIDDLPTAPNETPTEFAGGDEAITSGGSGAGIDISFVPIDPVKTTPNPVIVGARLNSNFASQFQPRYPSGLLRLNQEGVVSVRVLVGTNGRAKDIQLISSPHEGFWDATKKHALKKWRFKAATKDGKAIESWMTLQVQFEINS